MEASIPRALRTKAPRLKENDLDFTASVPFFLPFSFFRVVDMGAHERGDLLFDNDFDH